VLFADDLRAHSTPTVSHGPDLSLPVVVIVRSSKKRHGPALDGLPVPFGFGADDDDRRGANDDDRRALDGA